MTTDARPCADDTPHPSHLWGAESNLCPGVMPAPPARPFKLRTVNGSRTNYVIRVDGRAVGQFWRTSRDDRRAPWAYRIRYARGLFIYDLSGNADTRTAAEAEIGNHIRKIQHELGE